jgi:hypothetical protein
MIPFVLFQFPEYFNSSWDDCERERDAFAGRISRNSERFKGHWYEIEIA